MTPGKMVKEFHERFGLPVEKTPDWVFHREDFRMRLIDEELCEFLDEVEEKNLIAAAKEAADIVYVIYGMFWEFGVDLDKVFEEVHRSNMSKLWEDGEIRYREDGKVLKPPTYSPADVKSVIYGIIN